jgi:hypothetical protein
VRLTDEAHIDGDKQDDGLGKEDTHGPADVLDNQLLEVDLDLFLLGVYTPVLGATTQFAGLGDEHNRRIRLLHEEEEQYEGYKAHEAADVLGPPPAQVALRDEAADEGRKQRAHEDGGREDGDGEPPQFVVEHVGEDGGDDGERGGAEDAGEEATYEDGLEVFCYGDGDAEDGEAEGGDDERGLAAVELGEGRPHLVY